MITKEELAKMLVDYHAVPYRNRESAAEELAEKLLPNVATSIIECILNKKLSNRNPA